MRRSRRWQRVRPLKGSAPLVNPLLAARLQMTVSLAFHMVFAAVGIGLPLLLLIVEGLWMRTGKPHYRELARTWGSARLRTSHAAAPRRPQPRPTANRT